jgi:hypothetical protein
MTNQEIMKILRDDEKTQNQMLKEIVEKRVMETSKEKFDMQDVYFYSKYFNVSMSNLLLGVLKVSQDDYKKFVKGYLRQINSEKFNKLKNKYINRQKTKLKYRVNWNKKTYYNRENLIASAIKYGTNTKDFSMQVLGKSVQSTNRVLQDFTNKKRLFIGQYVRTSLPNEYIEANIKIITEISRKAISKVIYKFGIRLSKDDYNEEVQKCVIFINYNGNNLTKNNKPRITSDKYKNWHGKIFYLTALYFEMRELQKIKIENYYNDKIKYSQNENFEKSNIFDLIQNLELNYLQEKIIKKLYAGYEKEEIMAQEKMSEELYNKNLENIRKQLQNVMV